MKIFKQLRNSLYNLFYYFKIIWSDRDWDYQYIEVLMYYKLKKVYKFRQSEDCIKYVGKEKCDQALQLCITILARRLHIDTYYSDCDIYFALVEDRDWKTYCNLIKKYQHSWWD